MSASVHAEPSLRGYENLRAASSDASTLCNSAFTSATLLSLRHGVTIGPPRDAIREPAHHIDRDQQTQIARRRREILPRADGLEDRRAVRHARFAFAAVLELAAVLDRRHARLHLLFERGDRLLHRAQRIERRRRHHIVHRVVEVLDAKLGLLEREIAVLRVLRDFLVGQPPQRAVLVAHDRPEALEARAAERGILGEQEIAAPKALARDRAVGLPVDREE